METAAENYYGKHLSELDLPQTALLAGMPQAPNSYDPYTKPDTAKNAGMLYFTQCTTIKISKAEYEKAKATPIDEGLVPLKASDDNRKVVIITSEVINEVKAKLVKCLHRRTRYLHKLRYECPKTTLRYCQQ